jgi:single-strand DNA-binding protein
MAQLMKLKIIGYLGKKPELRWTPEPRAVCSFSVAVTINRRLAGLRQGFTNWFHVRIFGDHAQSFAENLGKGDQVFVEGNFRIETYDKTEGGTGARYVVEADTCVLLAPKEPEPEYNGDAEAEVEEDEEVAIVQQRVAKQGAGWAEGLTANDIKW